MTFSVLSALVKTPWIIAQCRSMPIQNLALILMSINSDHCRSMAINSSQFRSMLDQGELIGINWQWSALIGIDQHGLALISIGISLKYQWFQSLFKCRVELLNFSMGFNIIAPYMEMLHIIRSLHHWYWLALIGIWHWSRDCRLLHSRVCNLSPCLAGLISSHFFSEHVEQT